MTYYIFNQVFGSLVKREGLPDGVKLGFRRIGPSYNDRTAPFLYVTSDKDDLLQVLHRNGVMISKSAINTASAE